jgi:hypothetical protein
MSERRTCSAQELQRQGELGCQSQDTGFTEGQATGVLHAYETAVSFVCQSASSLGSQAWSQPPCL